MRQLIKIGIPSPFLLSQESGDCIIRKSILKSTQNNLSQMPDLLHTFDKNDPSFLLHVAESWGVEELGGSFEEVLGSLLSLIDQKDILDEFVDLLPSQAKNALSILAGKNGKMSWADFSRQFGGIREMGAARRDRDRPDLHPVSVAEILYYRGFLGKVFLDEKPEPREFAYIPDEILSHLKVNSPFQPKSPGKPAMENDCKYISAAGEKILEDACTLLAAIRMEFAPDRILSLDLQIQVQDLMLLLKGAGLLDAKGIPFPAPTKSFLEMPKSEAMLALANTWKCSSGFNDLRQVPGLIFEGNWQNDPIGAREVILAILAHIPDKTWWDLNEFIEYVHLAQPNFLRPSGDYNTWSIRDAKTGNFLRGFESWYSIEGALIRYMITGPLHWLGFLDLSSPAKDSIPKAFRYSRYWDALQNDRPPALDQKEDHLIFINHLGKISVPFGTLGAVRYQIARFCDWVGGNRHGLTYQISHESLKRANKQGLKVPQLIKILQSSSSPPFPPTLLVALMKWEKTGSLAKFEQIHVLRVDDPSLISILQKSRAGKFIVETLNSNTVSYRAGGERMIQAVLLEAGYFSELAEEKEV